MMVKNGITELYVTSDNGTGIQTGNIDGGTLSHYWSINTDWDIMAQWARWAWFVGGIDLDYHILLNNQDVVEEYLKQIV